MRNASICGSILRHVFCDEPVVKRREGGQAKVPCRCRQGVLAISCGKLARLTERLTSAFVFRWNVKPGKECSHVGPTEGKQRKRNRMTSSKLDWLVSQPGQGIQQDLRVFKDGAK